MLYDRIACCSPPSSRGAWRFPNSKNIQGSSPGTFYLARGSGSLQLNRRNSAIEPTGEFTCLIPSESNNRAQSLFIGVFVEEGMV